MTAYSRAVGGDAVLHRHPPLGEGAGLVGGDTVTEPSVSTACSRRGIACAAAIRRAPSASASVTTAGSDSGTAATTRLTAVITIRPPAGRGARRPAKTTPGQARPRPARAPGPGRRAGAAAASAPGRVPPPGRRSGPARCPRRSAVTAPAARPVATTVPASSLLADGPADRHRLAGQRGLVELQPVRLDQQQVGRDDVAGLEPHQVARHHVGGGDRQVPAVADHPGGGRGELVQRRDRPVRADLLGHADGGVHHHDQDDHRGVG